MRDTLLEKLVASLNEKNLANHESRQFLPSQLACTHSYTCNDPAESYTCMNTNTTYLKTNITVKKQTFVFNNHLDENEKLC